MALAGFEPARCPTVSGPLCPLSYSAIYRLFTGILRFSQAVRRPVPHGRIKLPALALGCTNCGVCEARPFICSFVGILPFGMNPIRKDAAFYSLQPRSIGAEYGHWCRMEGATSRPGFVGWLCRAAYSVIAIYAYSQMYPLYVLIFFLAAFVILELSKPFSLAALAAEG